MDPDLLRKLLKLPLEIQAAVASGYAAYMIAFAGIRAHHKAVDVGFSTIVFSMVTTLVLAALASSSAPIAWNIAIAVVVTLVAGATWRLFGRATLRTFIRASDISWADDDPSVWAAFLANTDVFVSQIGVLLDDGTWLRCDDTTKLSDAPFGPCCLGTQGDVALYLTHVEEPNGAARALKSVRDDHYGDRITYVPADRIRRVTLRYKRPF